MGTTKTPKGRMAKRPDPVAFSLKSGQFRQRIVKSKVAYSRKKKQKSEVD